MFKTIFAWILGLSALTGMLAAADQAKPNSPTATAISSTAKAAGAAKPSSATAAAPAALKDAVLYSVKAGKHSAIARMDVNGACKRFLSQVPGRRWVASLPVEHKADDLGAVGSADGKWIAFYSTRSGHLNLWLAKSDGSAVEALTSEDVDISPRQELGEELAFSPDSKSLAFVMHGDLWLMDLASRGLVTLSSGKGVKALTWSPNSRWIAFVQGLSLRRIGVAGAPLELLASGTVNYPTLAWTGDSDKGALLFFGRGLQRVSLDRKVELLYPSLLTPNRVRGLPTSPDKGLLLAQLSNGGTELFFANFEGKARKAEQVTNGGAEDALFLPDGKAFLFLRQGRLWRCNLDGRQAKPITDADASLPWAGKLAPGECL